MDIHKTASWRRTANLLGTAFWTSGKILEKPEVCEKVMDNEGIWKTSVENNRRYILYRYFHSIPFHVLLEPDVSLWKITHTLAARYTDFNLPQPSLSAR